MSKPETTIEILNVPLSPRQAHTYRFESFQQQRAFFSERVVCTFSGYTYARRTWKLRLSPPEHTYPREWRYLRFTNPTDYHTYYYFINHVEYVNDATVELDLSLDVLQSYMFNWDLRECFVERQHTETDALGEHTLDEGLEMGELINVHEYDVEGLQQMCIVILSSVYLSDKVTTTPDPASAGRFDNIFSGLGVYAVDLDDWVAFSNLLDRYSELGAIDGIVSMYMYPKNLLVLKDGHVWGDGDIVKQVAESGYTLAPLATYSNYKSKLFGGYQPRNNKLYMYPYNFLYVTNNAGGSAEFHYERFTNTDDGYTFDIYGGISPDAGIRINPARYNGGGYEYGLALGNYPSCAWNSDTYKVWLAQNYNTLNAQGAAAGLRVAAGAAMIAASPFTGGATLAAGAGVAYSGISQVAGLMAQKRDMQTQPPQARGSHSVTVNTNANKQTFTFYYKTVTAEYAQQIDGFFTMYGYKINTVRQPNIYAKRGLTYVKTVGCSVGGNICGEDIAEIEALFDRGITFWQVYPATSGTLQYTDYMGVYDYDPQT